MTLPEAQTLLEGSTRDSLKDSWDGCKEVTWYQDDEIIATGYYGLTRDWVSFGSGQVLTGKDARELEFCGTQGRAEYN